MVKRSLEYALKNVVDAIGNNYDLPQGEFLANVFYQNSDLRNPFFNQTPNKVKFMFGTQIELDIWLKQTPEKYPLIWLVYPLRKTYDNTLVEFEQYEKVRLIFAINNEVDKVVQSRVQTTRVVLESIIGNFSKMMRQGVFTKYISIDKTKKIVEEFYPNYSAKSKAEANKSIDVWDAITFDCDLILIPNCIK